MFNLDLAIEQWCVKISQQYQPSASDIDELKDHIYSAVEAGTQQGQSEQAIFDTVIAQFGDLSELGEHFGKKDRQLGRWLLTCSGSQSVDKRKKATSEHSVALAVVFALGMIFAAVQIDDKDTSMVIMLLLIAMWFSVDAIQNGRSAAREWRCLKRWVQRRMGA